ncbi:LuxR C-terminal-related transcriptional regulator [Oceanobacillus sp. FSL H7-0719]|uniref:LuxR C-terminal-related transcriptional regulator n=1 Tax=Oceanobacillus sp. FSL H7-0719 TaxID=2954507 RepID=UPI003254DB35
MGIISFVMGTEVHKTSIVDMVSEMLPEHKVIHYKNAFIDDLFQSNESSDLIVLDLEAHISLREVIRNYRYSNTKIAVILPESEIAEIDDYMRFSLMGFFSVNMDVHEIADGIKYMLNDITYVHPRVAAKLYENYKQLFYKEVNRPIDLLTRREWEVLGELIKGYQNEEIAVNLSISDKTVKNHITSILAKLGVKDRTNAVLLALHERWFYL